MTEPTSQTPEADAASEEGGKIVILPSAAESEPGPAGKAIAFVKKHPVLTVAGGLAAGVIVSAVLPKKASRKAIGRAVELARTTGTAALLAGHDVAGKAEKLGLGARKQAQEAAGRAEEMGEKAADRISAVALAALAAATAFGKATAGKAEELGSAAADRSGRIVDIASELRKRIRP